jgi:hypothetical protein
MEERRRPEAYRLREYVAALKEVQAMSDQEWLDCWVKNAGTDTPWMPKAAWEAYLQMCVVAEADRLTSATLEAA